MPHILDIADNLLLYISELHPGSNVFSVINDEGYNFFVLFFFHQGQLMYCYSVEDVLEFYDNLPADVEELCFQKEIENIDMFQQLPFADVDEDE